jgi:hypothetical protein
MAATVDQNGTHSVAIAYTFANGAGTGHRRWIAGWKTLVQRLVKLGVPMPMLRVVLFLSSEAPAA